MDSKMNNGDMPAMSIAFTENMAKLMEHEKALSDWSKIFGGMSKREYFAAMAMQGYISGGGSDLAYLQLGAMKDCVSAADRLLEALEANNG
jgi:hypothetical protein